MLCNCYLYVKSQVPTLPPTKTILSEVSVAYGSVAVFNYSGTKHYAVVEGMGEGTFFVSETNFRRCKATKREISFTDPAFLGFYTP